MPLNNVTPLVSILTPTYNQEKYINQCIESVLAQTFPNWELLIVDDGSLDSTREQVQKFKDCRITLIEQEHVGISNLRDTYAHALERARGSLIAILDGDDWWIAEKLETQTRAFRNPQVGFSYGSSIRVSNLGSSEHRIPHRFCGCLPSETLFIALLEQTYIPDSVTVMIRKQIIDDLGGFIQPAYLPLVDIPTWLHALRQSVYSVGIREILGCYRVYAQSVVRTHRPDIEAGHIRYANEYLERNWRSLNLSEKKFLHLKNDINSNHFHRQGERAAMEKNWAVAFTLFQRAMLLGGWKRKIKSGLRIGYTGIRMLKNWI